MRKFGFGSGLWLSFFVCWTIIGFTMHRGLAKDIDPAELRWNVWFAPGVAELLDCKLV
jgi:hypothetical protein